MIRISPDSPLKSKIQHANKKTMRKMTALFKNRTMVQASTLGPHKHKRERLRYLGRTIIRRYIQTAHSFKLLYFIE